MNEVPVMFKGAHFMECLDLENKWSGTGKITHLPATILI